MADYPMLYADYAAAAPMRPEVADAMRPYWFSAFGNPDSAHPAGREAAIALEKAKGELMNLFGGTDGDVLLTGSGTEANHAGILTLARRIRAKDPARKRILLSAVEHASVLEMREQLEENGFFVSHINCDSNGKISIEHYKSILDGTVALTAVMGANNETGARQPLLQIGELAHGCNSCFFVDAVALAVDGPLAVDAWHADGASVAGSKLGAGKGIGALYLRHTDHLPFYRPGGGQQHGLLCGTVPVAHAVGLAKAWNACLPKERARVANCEQVFLKTLFENDSGGIRCVLPQDTQRIPGYLCLILPGADRVMLQERLAHRGICVSRGSACDGQRRAGSHTLAAMGLAQEEIRDALRISFGFGSTEDEAVRLGKEIRSILEIK
ncbi:MAG: aminotransferase class V-fold PLP-dependent enzyme [Clostridia bacterium]|nr:aminotransferase class V-fold PLP-dependent enzyme [Clostridia bacterium]